MSLEVNVGPGPSGVETVAALVHFLGRKISIHNLLYTSKQRLLQAMKGGRSLLGTTTKSHKLNILLDGWEGLRTRLEFYIPLKKKGFILQSKGAHF